ncbi:ornithine carbamoyltransferase [Usitatibacter palustris]|uniref:Ornithine carbamoyltransferase n=1 Tax=Usitatibacter palustris TaxID=2732487 RepID=A0A6M4HA28_9PROT|nr:ornithine carbamoyltransferase [Usitatibacter palustris]QJR16406.1 Ornithine carbamoyltransferase, anabolic [Usitatibacter palustris]
MKHFLRFSDLDRADLEHLFARTRILKERFKNYVAYQPLVDRMLAMVFEKSSTRTRVSFEAGIYQLGGSSIVLNMGETQLGRGEPIEDVARVITRMVDIVMIRTFEHSNLERFAAHSRVPVINGLTNDYHPCQVLGDIHTYQEHRGPIQDKTVAWIGDSNNMCNTWLEAAPLLGFKLNVASPTGYDLAPARASGVAKAHLEMFSNPRDAAKGADLVTTDVWTSMGFEAENAARQAAFAGFMVDGAIMKVARDDALFMHCLPAHRGEEVAADVVDGPQSVVWEEAENRLHVQKALMEYLLLGKVES